MEQPSNLLNVVVYRWAATLGSTEFKIIAYLYSVAAATEDGKISKSISEIAEATNLAWRTVQAKLQDLDARSVIEVISENKDRTLIRIPPRNWNQPVNTLNPVADQPAAIPELIYRLCGRRATPQTLALMNIAAGEDEQRLRYCLDTFLRQDNRWESVELLAVAVQHDLKHRGYFDPYWSRP